MLQKFEISGVHYDVDDHLRAYVIKKIGDLDRYLPEHSRLSAHLEVRLLESKIDGKKQAVCEAVLYLPHDVITLNETGANMYAVVDMLKVKLRQQIRKYKDENISGKQRRHLLGRLKHRVSSALSSSAKNVRFPR